MPSACVGILGDINKFNIAGDGTYMPTNASHYGKKICDCNWNGVNPVTVNANILILLRKLYRDYRFWVDARVFVFVQ